MRAITVHITQEDIDYGQQQNNGRCAAVLALKAADPEIERVTVTRDEIRFSHRGDETRYTIRSPRSLARFVDAFDPPEGKREVRPIAFTIDPETAINRRPISHENGPDRMMREAGRPRITTGRHTSERPLNA